MKLSSNEINLTLTKIRNKYLSIVKNFNKSRALVEAFETRYMNALRSKMNLSVFLMAEIEAVEEIYNKEALKHELELQKFHQQPKEEKNDSFVDKVMENNRQKILKYSRLTVSKDTSEEIERLMGAMRDLTINYWPAIDSIYRDNLFSADKRVFGEIYQKLLENYDIKGIVPIAKHYIDALNIKPMNSKKINVEYNYLMKETAFLLHDILDNLNAAMRENKIPNENKILELSLITIDSENSWFYEYFKNLTHRQSVEKVYNFVKGIIDDFRIHNFKRKGF